MVRCADILLRAQLAHYVDRLVRTEVARCLLHLLVGQRRMWSHVLQAWLSVVLGQVQHVMAEKIGKSRCVSYMVLTVRYV